MPPKFSEQIDVPYIDRNAGNSQHRTSPCEYACPAGNPIQKINTLIAKGKEREACIFLVARNPMSAITSRVCPRPCESDCNRKALDEAVTIRDIEYHISNILGRNDMDFPRPSEQTGKRIAVVGAGPAGLTCAYFLALFGHQVTILEAENVAGGVPGLVIPEQKLAEDVVQQSVKNVLKTGISIKTGIRIGKDVTLEELHKNNNAVVLAVGAWEERALGVEGEDACMHALDFLKMARSGDLKNLANHVVIIGGGGVAFDCAMVAKQNGASHVRILCLEREDSLCAYPDDAAAAKEAGIDITGSCRVKRIDLENGDVRGVSTRRIRSFRFDEAGRLLVEDKQDSREKINADSVIIAIGQRPGLDSFLDGKSLEVNPNGTIYLDEKTGMTSMDGIFAAGDAVLGPSTIAASIGSGREAAIHADRYIMDRDKDDQFYIDMQDCVVRRMEVEGQKKFEKRHVVTSQEILNTEYYLEKIEKTGEIKGNRIDNIIQEASRCMHCGQCRTCWICVEDCPGLILSKGDFGPVVEYPDECWHCGCCRIACPTGAISYQFPLHMLL